jgi:hypothetical protein
MEMNRPDDLGNVADLGLTLDRDRRETGGARASLIFSGAASLSVQIVVIKRH